MYRNKLSLNNVPKHCFGTLSRYNVSEQNSSVCTRLYTGEEGRTERSPSGTNSQSSRRTDSTGELGCFASNTYGEHTDCPGELTRVSINTIERIDSTTPVYTREETIIFPILIYQVRGKSENFQEMLRPPHILHMKAKGRGRRQLEGGDPINIMRTV